MNEKNNKNKNQRYILTRETFGMTILLFCVIIFVMLLTREYVFSSIGTAVCTFMYGAFGYGSYLVLAALAYFGVWLVWEKSIKLSAKCSLFIALSVILCFLLFHSVTTSSISIENYGTYLSLCYNNAAAGFSGYTFGGAVAGLVVYPIAKLTTFVGAYVIFGVLFAGALYLSAVFLKDELSSNKSKNKSKKKKAKRAKSSNRARVAVKSESSAVAAEPVQEISYADPYGATENYQIVDNVPSPVYIDHNAPVQNNGMAVNQPQQTEGEKYSSKNLGRKILFEKGEFAAESYRRNMIFDESSYFNRPTSGSSDYMSSFGGSSSRSSSGSSGSSASSSNVSSSGSYGSSSGTPVSSSAENSSNINGQSYSESYRQSVEKGTGYTPSSYVYGDKPVEKLDDSTLNEGVYKEENTIQPEPEKTEYVQPEPEKPVSEVNYGQSSETSDYNEHTERSRGVGFDSYNELQSDPEPISRRSEDRSVRGLDDSDKLFSDDLSRNNDLGGFRRDESVTFTERSEDSVPPARESRESIGEERGRSSDELFGVLGSDRSSREAPSPEPDITDTDRGRQDRSKANIFDDDNDDILGSSVNDRAIDDIDIGGDTAEPTVIPERRREMVHIAPPTKEQVEEKLEPPKPKHVWKKYVAPPLDLLQNYSESGSSNAVEIEENKVAIVETLANVRIESEIINVIVGSKFTRYDVRIKDNTAIKLALKHKDEIQIALRKDTINAYINFKLAALSIEVPNRESGTVGLKSMLSSGQFLNSKSGSLVFALGKNIEGDCICPDITKMPHLLVAGSSGSGKSVCLSSLIISLLYRYGPDELRFILVDPKQVEFIPYENLPHLMINEIIFDVDKAIKALNWAIKEMERRYQLFKELTANGVATKDINEYNSHVPEGEEKLCKIVIILDEFGDLMLQAKKEIETRIVRLVQKARACGIHLILATQRPSVDCITGLIKSNLSTRIGFKVNSFADSSTIFDVGGAEKLLGAGDMYYRRSDRPELQRVQGCFISSAEIQKVTDFVKANNETYFDDSVSDFINTAAAEESSSSGSSDDVAAETDTKIDDTFINALKYCVTSNQASVSMIQRRFPVGYIKACKIIDWMENMNYITQSEGSKPRKVLLSREEFTNIYGDIDD